MHKHVTVLAVSQITSRVERLTDIVMKMWLWRRQYDVAIVQFYSGNSFIWQYFACKIAKSLGKKLVITIHGGSVPERIKKYPQRYLPLMRKADVITCPSPYMIHRLAEYDIKPLLIENYTDLSQYPQLHKELITPRLLWMRAFSPIYNPLMAVRVVARLKQKFPDIKLYMAGKDMGQLKETKALAEKLNLLEHIEFVGFLDIAAKRKYAELADIYISTNKVDNAPVTFLEMWAMGLPIVSTNAGGIPYVVKAGETGLLVGDDNDEQMAERVTSLIQDQQLTAALIRQGREACKNYEEDAIAEKWIKLLNEL